MLKKCKQFPFLNRKWVSIANSIAGDFFLGDFDFILWSDQPIYDDWYYQQHHISASTKSISVFEPTSNNTREWSRLKNWKWFLLKNWQKCIYYYYFSDFARGERCWCADCQWRYAAAGLSPNLMLWMWADVFREIDWNRGKDSVQVRAEFFRENNAVILASFAVSCPFYFSISENNFCNFVCQK